MKTLVYRGPRTRVDYPTELRIPVEKGEDVLLAVDVPQEVSDEIARRAQNVTGERVDVEPVQSEPVQSDPRPKTGKEG